MEAINRVFWFKTAVQNYANQPPVPAPKWTLEFDLTHRRHPASCCRWPNARERRVRGTCSPFRASNDRLHPPKGAHCAPFAEIDYPDGFHNANEGCGKVVAKNHVRAIFHVREGTQCDPSTRLSWQPWLFTLILSGRRIASHVRTKPA